MSANVLHLTSPAKCEKLVAEVVAADYDFSQLKDIRAGETITGTPTVTYTGTTEAGAADTTLTLGAFVANAFTAAAPPVVSGSVVQVGISGGTVGSTYLLSFTIVTSGGKTRKRVAALSVI